MPHSTQWMTSMLIAKGFNPNPLVIYVLGPGTHFYRHFLPELSLKRDLPLTQYPKGHFQASLGNMQCGHSTPKARLRVVCLDRPAQAAVPHLHYMTLSIGSCKNFQPSLRMDTNLERWLQYFPAKGVLYLY